jgi:hypothetical protein
MRSPWAVPGDDRITPQEPLPDPVPPGHGEPEGERQLGSSNTCGFEVCPDCRSADLSYDGPGWMAEFADGPDTPLVCEDCGWTGRQEEAL